MASFSRTSCHLLQCIVVLRTLLIDALHFVLLCLRHVSIQPIVQDIRGFARPLGS
jgi:hypothetical protein